MTELSLPEKFEEYAAARKTGFLKAMELKKNGGKLAGTFCTFTPREVFEAAGFKTVSLCGMSDETIGEAEAHLPKNLCPLIKSSYGFAITDKCPYFYFADIIVGETTCDGKKKMYEMLNKLKYTHVMQLPQTIEDPFSYTLWNHEINKIIEILNTKFDGNITDEKLREACKVRNKLRGLYCELFELGKLNPPAIKGKDVYKVIEGAGFSFDLEEQYNNLRSLIDKIKADYEKDNKTATDTKRILITGCPIGGVLEKVVGGIEDNGGAVVCFENCGGIKPARNMIDVEAQDIVAEIGRRYLEIGCSVMSPNPKRLEMLEGLLDEFKIDGVVDVVLQACHTYNVETSIIKELCMGKGVPYMAIETDYSKSDSGQLNTRLTAFIEIL